MFYIIFKLSCKNLGSTQFVKLKKSGIILLDKSKTIQLNVFIYKASIIFRNTESRNFKIRNFHILNFQTEPFAGGKRPKTATPITITFPDPNNPSSKISIYTYCYCNQKFLDLTKISKLKFKSMNLAKRKIKKKKINRKKLPQDY